jgi:hypothetical protein
LLLNSRRRILDSAEDRRIYSMHFVECNTRAENKHTL